MPTISTSVWLLALRRGVPSDMPVLTSFKLLIQTQQAWMLGCVRQELLSGIRSQMQFDQLKKQLSAFPDFSIQQYTYELAAEIFNICRTRGIKG